MYLVSFISTDLKNQSFKVLYTIAIYKTYYLRNKAEKGMTRKKSLMHWERVDGMNSPCKEKQPSFGAQPANRCYRCGRAQWPFYTVWKEILGDGKPRVCISKKCELNIPQNPLQNKLLEDLLFQSLYFILQRDLQTNKKKKKEKANPCIKQLFYLWYFHLCHYVWPT